MAGWVRFPPLQERSDRRKLLIILQRIVIDSGNDRVDFSKDIVLLPHVRDGLGIWTSHSPAVLIALGKGRPEIFFEKIKEALQKHPTLKWTSSQENNPSLTIGFRNAESHATTVHLYYVLDLDPWNVDEELQQVLEERATSRRLITEIHPSLRPVIALAYRHFHAWALQRGFVDHKIGLIRDVSLLMMFIRTLQTSLNLKTGEVYDKGIRAVLDRVQQCQLKEKSLLTTVYYAYALLWAFFNGFSNKSQLKWEGFPQIVLDELESTSRECKTANTSTAQCVPSIVPQAMQFAQRIRAGTLSIHHNFSRDYQLYVKFSVTHWTASKRRGSRIEAAIVDTVASFVLGREMWAWPVSFTSNEEHSIFIALQSSSVESSEAKNLCQQLEQAYDRHMKWQDPEDIILSSEYFVQAQVLEQSEMSVAWSDGSQVTGAYMEVDFNEEIHAGIISALQVTVGDMQREKPANASHVEGDARAGPWQRWILDHGDIEAANGYQRLFWLAANDKGTGPESQKKDDKPDDLANARTETEALNRIAWDPCYDEDDYLIGYEDRHEGIKEIAFLAWKRESTDMEFIPSHRIRYIKRQSSSALVWGRNGKWKRQALGVQE